MGRRGQKVARLVGVKAQLQALDPVSKRVRPKVKKSKTAGRRKSETRQLEEHFERLSSIQRWGRQPDDEERIVWPLKLGVARMAERRGLMTSGELAKSREGFEPDALTLFEYLETPPQLGELYSGVMAVAHRKKLGAYYTPEYLARRVVRTTLYPIFAVLGKRRTPEQILSLKICDPACGGGAFLLQVVRQLASELRRAWRRHGYQDLGDAAAKRLVAEHCTYGVDKDPMAVTVCHLALWLEVGDSSATPESVGRNVKFGDALVGLHSLRQLEAFHWDISKLAYVKPMWEELTPEFQTALAIANAGGCTEGACRRLAEICKRHGTQGLGHIPQFWRDAIVIARAREIDTPLVLRVAG